MRPVRTSCHQQNRTTSEGDEHASHGFSGTFAQLAAGRKSFYAHFWDVYRNGHITRPGDPNRGCTAAVLVSSLGQS